MPTFAHTWSPGTLTQESDGTLSVATAYEGTAEGLGTVLGTFRSRPVGKTSGTYEDIGVAFPESGEPVNGVGTGEWTQVAPGQWTTVGSCELSTGETIKTEGVISLAEHTWSGTFG
jgi:hypothetical protein